MKRNIQNKGITLIALVVTLVVLLILAGITISVVLSEGGIIAKAQSSKEKQEIAVWLDRLTVTEANTAVTYYAVDMEKYNKQLKTEGIVFSDDSNYESEDGGKTYNLTTDNGYVFNVSEPTPGDIVINYIGKNGELLPYIKEIKVISTTTNSSKIEVEVARLEDGKLTYEYKKHTEENYTLLKENKEVIAEFTELAQNEIYDIKVTAENKNGKSEAKIISIYTGKLQEGTISQKGETIWANGQASIELQTTDTTNTMQYQKNGIAGSWTNYGVAITGLVHGDIIYARMWDGTNGTSSYSIDILDDVDPQLAIISLSSTTTDTETPITATVSQKDNESGIDIIKCKWVYNTTSGSIGTNEASYTGGTFSSNPQIISLNASTEGTYYLHVLTIDKTGNKIESISNLITVNRIFYLADKVRIGDYVAYDAGNWTETVLDPTTSSTIGGYSIEDNKGISVQGINNGWRVLSVEGTGETAVVTIISSGCPAKGYYGHSGSEQTKMIKILDDFANNNFVNKMYAISARNAKKVDKTAMSSSNTNSIGANYWLSGTSTLTEVTGTGTKYTGTLFSYAQYKNDTKPTFRYWRSYGTCYTGGTIGSTYYAVNAINASGEEITRTIMDGTFFEAESRYRLVGIMEII